MSPADFCVYREEASAGSTTEIVFKAFERGADRSNVDLCLGFIRFSRDDGAGKVELTNRNATLQPWHLQIGGTSKRGAEDQAGTHGEGLKLAALVFLRDTQNHHLSCQSTGFNWDFNFKNKCLVVSVHRIKPGKKARQPERSAFKIAVPQVVADKDVQFIIGEARVGQDEKGSQVNRGPVQQSALESWTKAALFLTQVDNEDTGIVSTYHGDLLTAENLRGNIYLKGLLLFEGTVARSASITGRPLWFGYNFAGGQTNRDRQSVKTASEESRAMCNILSGAMKEKPDMIGALVDILNTTETEYADVACPEKHWPRDVGLLIRGYLLRDEFADRWFYCSEHVNKVRKPYDIQIHLLRSFVSRTQGFGKPSKALGESPLRYRRGVGTSLRKRTSSALLRQKRSGALKVLRKFCLLAPVLGLWCAVSSKRASGLAPKLPTRTCYLCKPAKSILTLQSRRTTGWSVFTSDGFPCKMQWRSWVSPVRCQRKRPSFSPSRIYSPMC